MKGWYILHTLATQEKRVADTIKKKIEKGEFKDIIYSVKVPIEQVIEMKDGKKIKKEQKFFPSYVLVEMEMNNESAQIIRKIPGATHFLGAGHKKLPNPLSKKEVDEILKKEEQVREVEKPSTPKIKFVIDESVKITDGPFKGFQGVVEDINTEKGRVKVRVEIFGRPTPVDLDFLQVERLGT
ncbi:MAG: transcription termination/antitermination protein NusG [Spirochaetes bacterium]|nr:transcription termination/antitermination protein NusG [Spirochaetota bacterium]